MPARVVMYLKPYCVYCVLAKRLLDKKGVRFDAIDVTGDNQKRAWLVEVTGHFTVSQIFIGDRPIGGFDALSRLDRDGKLDALLAGE